MPTSNRAIGKGGYPGIALNRQLLATQDELESLMTTMKFERLATDLGAPPLALLGVDMGSDR